MMDAYKESKLEKLKQLKKLMYELMAEEGIEPDEELEEGGLKEAMEEAEEEMASKTELPTPEDKAKTDLSDLDKLKREYFSPKVRERRPGTAIMFEQMVAKPLGPKKAYRK